MVLLDKLSKEKDLELVVAHFDHGIRKESADDAEFVKELARIYGLLFETKREDLGAKASEETARKHRYDFLRSVAKKHNARLLTAHHADDVIESIAINLKRGTGWRGLAVLDSDVIRPLTDLTKSEIVEYAEKNGLTWREDHTNSSESYLRNRLRKQTMNLDTDTKRQILALWSTQKAAKKEIDEIVETLLSKGQNYERYLFASLEMPVAVEILRYVTEGRLTRPQLKRALHAIKTFLPGKTLEAGDGVELSFTPRNFSVKLIK